MKATSAPQGYIKPLLLFLTSIAPGLILLGFNIGTGSITTMATAGARYGMMLAWPVFLSCVFTYYLTVFFGKYTVVTGNTALHSFRQHFGKVISLFILLMLLFSEYVSSMGVMSIVTQTVQEWTASMSPSGKGIHPIWSTFFFGGLLYYLYWNSKYSFVEKIFIVFTGLMALSFVLSMVLVIPEPADILRGMVPSLPESSNTFLLIAGMVGTTMGGILYVVRSVLVKQKGWGIGDLSKERRDARISSALIFLLSIAIMACAAATMFPLGLEVNNAIDMVRLLEPLAGRFAMSIFVAGIICAGLSSILPHMLVGPWLIADYKGEEVNIQSRSSRLIGLFVVSLGFVVPIFGGRPVFVMILSQVFFTIITPLIIGLMLWLQNKPGIMGDHKPDLKMNIIISITLIFSLIMAGFGIAGLLGL